MYEEDILTEEDIPTKEEINDYIKIEKEIIKEFAKSNPYPEYKEIYNFLKINSENNLTCLDMLCEYHEINHNYCKIIYDNPNNEELIIDIGKKIYDRGGMQALQQNYYVLKLIYSNSTNNIIKGYSRIIENYFQKVTYEWLA